MFGQPPPKPRSPSTWCSRCWKTVRTWGMFPMRAQGVFRKINRSLGMSLWSMIWKMLWRILSMKSLGAIHQHCCRSHRTRRRRRHCQPRHRPPIHNHPRSRLAVRSQRHLRLRLYVLRYLLLRWSHLLLLHVLLHDLWLVGGHRLYDLTLVSLGVSSALLKNILQLPTVGRPLARIIEVSIPHLAVANS